ncbi:MAG: S8 family peptidase [Candidatus Peregrinibacteria bacterium]
MRPTTSYATFAALSAALLLSPLLLSAAQNGKKSSPVVPGQYIVLTKGDNVDQVTRRHNVTKKTKHYGTLKGFAARLSDQQAEALRNDPDVAVIQPDYVVEALKRPPRSSSSSAPSVQTLPTGVDRIDADLSSTAQIDGVSQTVDSDIAVIDTGVQKSHPDLTVVQQVNFTRERSADDQNGHGTHVAGTAAAKDNTAGVVGVAPGARIWSVKVLNRKGSGYLSDVIEGIDYVTANASQIEVANMSLGCTGCQTAAMDLAIDQSVAAGVVYVVSAGNDGIDAANDSPANHSDVITVSAIADFNGQPGGGAAATCRADQDDTFADFSNYGSVVDIAAPGVCILSTYKGSKYAVMSGTSMASPHVTGAAALYILTHGKPTNAAGVAAVRAALIAGGTAQADPEGFSGDPDAFAEPLVNAEPL